MKFLRFLLGFICGIWTLIVTVIGFVAGGIIGYELAKDERSERPDYSRPYKYSEYK